MRDVSVIGVGMTHFGKHMDRSMKDLCAEAVGITLEDAGIAKEDIQLAAAANSAWGAIEGQVSIRGQVVLRNIGIGGMPVINVENACASGSTAFHVVWSQIASGLCDVGLALGFEKLHHPEKEKVMMGFLGGTDMEQSMKMIQEYIEKQGFPSNPRTIFMDIYAREARKHMEKYGTTQQDFAVISAKNHHHSTMNPHAQYQKDYTVDEVLADKEVVFPLTRAMCSPMSDGAAAAILCSSEYAEKLGAEKPVKVLASLLTSGADLGKGYEHIARRLSRTAYEVAGVGPEDVDVAEVHDATAYAELAAYEHLGWCEYGGGGELASSGATALGGKLPTNTSGGLESKGHPVGATGLGQITEVVWQLRGRCGARQVEGARVGMVHNGGGAIEPEEAAMCITILQSGE
ncbi:MAG: thiolase family protein [Actinobacteria bacterium]|nr:thiolase family protein [Actinomycetota bacterium]MBU1944047.1 thiolase family protein [Actinomycetota bacterium]MBU2688542.1 thiolase family protein [Actinomycetota bacterium]